MATRWQRLQSLFHEAAALDKEQRTDYLAEQCGDDAELFAEVTQLLENDANSTLSQEVAQQAGAVLEGIDETLLGTELAQYRLKNILGSGGMGTVFRAERADGLFEREVAIKLIKRGMDTDAVVRRFEREREILARLSHSNIAALLDGGVSADDRPFFVMEYVQGVPINQYCDQHRLRLHQRIRLFQTVCKAVHFAHQNLIVHRDIKPSNILVNTEGEVKLLDFGIAKSLESEKDQTQTSAAPFTPAYASPEQLLGQSVSTASDVYGLGVVLYELLTGQLPFASRTAADQREQILSGDPSKPSTVVTQLREAAGKIGEHRRLDVNGLRRELFGDLDVICLTALRREPSERYSSAQALAQDLQLHLTQQPLQAQAPALGYRVQKFVRRNRWPVGLSAAALCLFVGFGTYYTQQLAKQRDIAQTEQRKTQQVVEFVTSLFAVNDPSESQGEDILVRDLLDEGSARIELELQDQPQIKAKLQQVMGRVYHGIGAYERSAALLQQAESLVDPSTANGLQDLALIHFWQSEVLVAQGAYEAGLLPLEKAQHIYATQLPADTTDLARLTRAKAFIAERLGKANEALSLYEEAVAMSRAQAAGRDTAELARSTASLAAHYQFLDRLPEAERLLNESIAMQARLFAKPTTESVDSLRILADVYRQTDRLEEAKTLYEEVIELRERLLGPDHQEVMHALNEYSQALEMLEDIEGALVVNQRMIDGLLRLNPDGTNQSMPQAYHNRAFYFRQLEQYPEAIEYFEKAIQAQDAIRMAPDHMARSFPIAAMGQVRRESGDPQGALQAGLKALELRQPHFEDNHRLMNEVRGDIGQAYADLAEWEQAETYLLRSYEGFVSRNGKDSRQAKETEGFLYWLYTKTNRPEMAAQYEAR